MAILPNELNQYRSYNYRWGLGVLDPSSYNSTSYKNSNVSNLIIQSGGFPDKRIKTSIEETLGINVEYFIEDVNIDSLISANPNTGVSNAITHEFTVVEPYSVGLFLQSLYIAALESGYTNYIEAPYVLICDWIGHTDSNTTVKIPATRHFAIKLINVTFNVNAKGCIYSVQAIPYNHMGLIDEYQKITNHTTVNGLTVDQMLESGEKSLARILNTREQAKVSCGEKLVGDLYRILFPRDLVNGLIASPAPAPAGGRGNGNAEVARRRADAQNAASDRQLIARAQGATPPAPRLSTDAEIAAFNTQIGGGTYTLDGRTITPSNTTTEFSALNANRFGNFNSDGTISGPGQSARPGRTTELGLRGGESTRTRVTGATAPGALGDGLRGGSSGQITTTRVIDTPAGPRTVTQTLPAAPSIGYGAGQVDPALARAAGITSSGPMAGSSVSWTAPPQQATIPRNPNSNDIGNSEIIIDFNTRGNVRFAFDNEYWDNEQLIYRDANFTVDSQTRDFEFAEGTKIEKIIEDVILQSNWGQTLLRQTPDANGNMNWFKIDIHVGIRGLQDQLKIGRPALEFQYHVVPYKVHKSRFDRVNAVQNYAPQIRDAVKAYYYSYTGLNQDIIDFEFNIDNSFYKPLMNMQTGGSLESPYAVIVEEPRFGAAADLLPGSPSSQNDNTLALPWSHSSASPNGMRLDINKRVIAEQFNRLMLNSDVDNVELTLRIWGDPYYLSDNDSGNYRSSSQGANINNDGTIEIFRNEVYVLLKFNSGVDYTGNLMALDPVSAFNGLYRVISLKNSFSRGKFTQELVLLRAPNQSQESVNLSTSLVSSFIDNINPAFILQRLSENIQSLGSGAFSGLFGQLDAGLHRFVRLGQINVQSFEKLLGTSVNDVIQNVTGFLNIGNLLNNRLRGTLGNFASGLANTVTGVNSALGQLQGNLNNLTRDLQTGLNKAVDNVSFGFNAGQVDPAFRNALANVSPQLNVATQQLTAQLGNLGPLNQALSSLPQNISTVLTNTKNSIQLERLRNLDTAIPGLQQQLRATVPGGVASLTSAASILQSSAASGLPGLQQTLAQTLPTVSQNLQQVVSNLGNTVPSVVRNLSLESIPIRIADSNQARIFSGVRTEIAQRGPASNSPAGVNQWNQELQRLDRTLNSAVQNITTGLRRFI
jgi:hypothetical protein